MRTDPSIPTARKPSQQFSVIAAFALLAATLLVGGCVKPLLAPDDERTPFDRYDGIRANYAPQYINDEYGLKRPNLRGRLSGKD